MMRLKTVTVFYIFILVVLAVLPFGTPHVHINKLNIDFRLDYLVHVIMYIPWAFLVVNGLRVKTIYAVFWGILFGMANETVQLFLTYRTFNINDLLANIIGILTGLLLIRPRFSAFILSFVKS